MHEELSVKLREQIQLMKLNAKSLQGQLDFQRARTEDMSKQLLNFQIQEGDSDYDVKQENGQLQAMVAHWIQHARTLEAKLGEMEQQKVASDLYSRCSMVAKDENLSEMKAHDESNMSANQQQNAPKKSCPTVRMRQCFRQETNIVHTTQINLDSLWAKSKSQPPRGSPILRKESDDQCVVNEKKIE